MALKQTHIERNENETMRFYEGKRGAISPISSATCGFEHLESCNQAGLL
jgi:hypothetical protein